MATSVGDELVYSEHLPGGTKMSDHANNGDLLGKIKSKKWDYVTLQTQSQESALPQDEFEVHVYPYMQKVVQSIRQNDIATVPLFFMTWGNETPSDRCSSVAYFCTFDGMNNKLKERHLFYAQQSNGAVVPAAVVWKSLREQGLSLFDEDGRHPSKVGAYANAVAFYAMIFEKDPTLLSYDDVRIDNEIESLIKQTVKKLVFEQHQRWSFYFQYTELM